MFGIKLRKEQINFIERNNLYDFKKTEIYESLSNNIKEEKSKIEILKLYGNHGEINIKEIEKMEVAK